MLTYHIEEAEQMLTEHGGTFGQDYHGRHVIEAAKKYAKSQSGERAPVAPVNEHIVRREDMGAGRLQLFREEDGDMCVMVIDSNGTSAGIQFCTQVQGGGHSPRTLAALYELAAAMIEDCKNNPLPSGFNSDGS